MSEKLAFLTLFLGLISGSQPVELAVSSEVANVEVRLDGKNIGVLHGPPWRLASDFGRELVPHRLDAIAQDQKGNELGTSTQWINLPRPPAEAHLLFEKGEDGYPRAATISWRTLLQEEPTRITATLDGRPLSLVSQNRILLPAYDPRRPHFLTVLLEFERTEPCRLEAAFGSGIQNEVGVQLTAVPILPVGSAPPDLDRLQGAFVVDGEQLQLVALEKADAQVIVIRGRGAEPVLRHLASSTTQAGEAAGLPHGDQAMGSAPRVRDSSTNKFVLSLDRDARLRFLWPAPQRISGSAQLAADLFPMSRAFSESDGGMPFLMTGMTFQVTLPLEQHLADAVGVAGLRASYGNYRRAVVLLIGKEPSDRSMYRPETVRKYLQSLHVPLLVWCLDVQTLGEAREAWGNVTAVTTGAQLADAVALLRRDLDRQRVAWVQGVYLPQIITLAREVQTVVVAQ